MEKAYEEIVNKIRSFTKEFVAQPFYFKNLDKDILCVYLYGGTHTSLLLYDNESGYNEVGEIRYRENKNQVFIAQFETNVAFQKCGLGRFMFNLALAHGDAVGATYANGCIAPTNVIKGVSGKGGYMEEKAALVEIYKKLGCRISITPTNSSKFSSDFAEFFQSWEPGAKLRALPSDQKQFLHTVVNLQNKLLEKK